MSQKNKDYTYSYSKKYSAGILPYAVEKGEIYYLLGYDWRDRGWSDFGGKEEIIDDGIKTNTACREFYEETMGSIYSLETLKDIFKNKNNYTEIRSTTLTGYPYYMYLIQIPYVNYKHIFLKINHFTKYLHSVEKQFDISKFNEKNDLRWFIASDLKLCIFSNMNNHLNIKFRNIFRQTIRNHFNTIIIHENNIKRINYNNN